MGKAKGLVLFHGAGGNKDHQTLTTIEEVLDIPVARCNFPYRDKKPVGPAGPNSMKVLVETINTKVGELADTLDVDVSAIAAGGRSLGGRACSVAHAEGLELAGLVLLSYPLHPPGKPEKLRTEHFGDISCPVLVVQGKKYPFGRPDEMHRHFKAISSNVSLEFIDGNHGPKDHDLIAATVGGWLEG